jgi:imidazolonepropionase-like amidohydrolase
MKSILSSRASQCSFLGKLFLLSVFFCTGTNATSTHNESHYDLAIVNSTVISPERNTAQENVVVLIRDGKIAAIVPKSAQYTASETLDGNNQFLIPGLIDSHVHLYHATGLKKRYAKNFDALYSAYIKQMPKSYLYHGFTTVIETNADKESNETFMRTEIRPDLKHCGSGLILSDGYMASEIPSGELLKYAPNFLYDNYRKGYLPEGVDPVEHSPHATVANIAATGASCIKVYYEEALWMPGGADHIALPSVELITDVVNEAHALGLVVIMHATSPNGHTMARKSGVDIISHGPWDWIDNDYYNPNIPEFIEQNLKDSANAQIYIQPTIRTIQHTASMFDQALLNRPELEKVLPKAFIDYLKTHAQVQRDQFINMFGSLITKEPTTQSVATGIFSMVARYKRMVGILAEQGGNLILGSDTSSGGFGWGNPPGLNGYWEMKDWASSGIPLDAIFSGATINNARAFGLQNEIGSVQVGKKANLLIVKSNPLSTVEAYDQIQTVIINGRALARETLSAN